MCKKKKIVDSQKISPKKGKNSLAPLSQTSNGYRCYTGTLEWAWRNNTCLLTYGIKGLVNCWNLQDMGPLECNIARV